MSAHLYQVRHTTEYSYDEDVSTSYGRAYLTPREGAGQCCRSSQLSVMPEPDLVSEHVDFFGNRSTYIEVHTPHRRLVVAATSTVEVDREPVDLPALDTWTWEAARDALAARRLDGDPEVALAHGFMLPSPQVALGEEVRAFADSVFMPARPLGAALGELVRRIHAEFTYRNGATSVDSTLPDVLARRAGVCQDFAHLAVGCLRSVGFAARYVSGYLETEPPPGRPKLQGADASHAWVSVLVPELGWIDLDPTNAQPADSRYVVTAWGRDYTDVPPLKGVIFTDSSKSALKVAVDVVRLPDVPAG